MKVGEQLKFFAALRRGRQGEPTTRGLWLARLSWTEWKNKKATELSKGMQQKVQFITAVIHDPTSILDEPFSAWIR